jgi:predicted ATPase/DNA-binding winged helix-turn-helix (wHTH) protein
MQRPLASVQPALTTVYRFGRFELQPRQRRLLDDGRAVELGHRAFDVLCALVERTGQLVTKDQLLGLVWPGVVVEENNLQVQVSTLRKILGTTAIATTAGRGYCFTLELTQGNESSSPPVSPRHNLPSQLTSFVGHADDLAELVGLLDQTRLLTLTGIGGCGKTRLAIEVAGRVVARYPDGVWYVDLAPLLDAERVALTVVTILGLREENDRPIIDTLRDRLAGKRALLVIDNCEHLLAACAALVQQVLCAAPGVRVLAGSREGLGIPGERAMTIRSLSFPPPDEKRDRRAVEGYEAVQLFADRARLAAPKVALDDRTAEAVAEICRRVDGIPLAIELAAARVKVLSVEEIRTRLDDRFRLLTGGSGTAMGRQQTLLSTIRWSYDHLAAGEQRLLRRLSVFVGGWTLEGAARVADGGQDEYAVLDLIGRLVDQSLVKTYHVEGCGTRYAMPETVRHYGQEQLNEAGESDATRERHLEFYVTLAEQAAPALFGLDQRTWTVRLNTERENFLAAHAWCGRSEKFAESGLRLVASLQTYFVEQGLLALGRRLAVEALARTGAQRRNLARCLGLMAASRFSYFMGRYRETTDYAQAGLTIAREIGDDERAAEALRSLGMAESELGNADAARARLQESLAIFRRQRAKVGLARVLNSLAGLEFDARAFDKAEPLYQEALALDRDACNFGCAAINLGNLAQISLRRGLGDRARQLTTEGLAIVEQMGLKRSGVWLLETTMELASSCGDWECAARLNGATAALTQEMGLPLEPDELSASHVARVRDALGVATYLVAETGGRALSYDEAIQEARAWLEQRS